MTGMLQKMRRAWLPLSVLVAALFLHYGWNAWLGPSARWLAVEPRGAFPSLRRYIEAGNYWLGISYGLALALAAAAYRKYREEGFCEARRLALGGVTFSGILSVTGCFLLACCGSPMLVVYASLFGTAFLPFAKPLMAVATGLSVLLAWRWMERGPKNAAPTLAPCDPDCGCDTSGSS